MIFFNFWEKKPQKIQRYGYTFSEFDKFEKRNGSFGKKTHVSFFKKENTISISQFSFAYTLTHKHYLIVREKTHKSISW